MAACGGKITPQLTLAIIKPDVIVPSLKKLDAGLLFSSPAPFQMLLPRSCSSSQKEDNHPLGKVVQLIHNNGFSVERSKLVQWRIEDAERFYEEHEGKFFYQRLVAFMTRCTSQSLSLSLSLHEIRFTPI